MMKMSVAGTIKVDDTIWECTKCHETFDQATAVATDVDAWNRPEPDQYAVCAHCYHVMKIASPSGLRDLSSEEKIEALQDEELNFILGNMGVYDDNPYENFKIATRKN